MGRTNETFQLKLTNFSSRFEITDNMLNPP